MSDYLPPEVLIKILTMVPPKSLIKFKCVSKSWNSLISSPYFVDLQTRQATVSKPTTLPSNQILIRRYPYRIHSEIYALYVDDNDKKFPFDDSTRIEYPFRGTVHTYYVIMGSCNGVLCLYDNLVGPTPILLWNPVIKRSVALPGIQGIPPNRGAYIIAHGFGFDAGNNDYKVVRLTYVKGDNVFQTSPRVVVYSLRARSWREINVETPRSCVVLDDHATWAFIKGNVHWMAVRREENGGKMKGLIMLLDVGLEAFHEMPLPERLAYYDKMRLKPVIIKESFAVCKHAKRVCSIWIMNEYGDVNSWSNMFNVRLCGVDTFHGFRTNGDVLLTRGRELVSYNLDTRATVDLDISGEVRPFYVGAYVETLALINEGEEARETTSILGDSESESD